MIQSYNKPRLKDALYIKMTSNRREGDPDPGNCNLCHQPLIILHEFSSKGHLAVCNNRGCPAHAQPQKYLLYPKFKQSQEEEEIKQQASRL